MSEYQQVGTLQLESTDRSLLRVSVECKCGNCGEALGFAGDRSSLVSPDLAAISIKVRPCERCRGLLVVPVTKSGRSALLDKQAAGSDLRSRDDVLDFFGASLKENGDLSINMKKYHAAHLCQEHSFQPWRRNEIEDKCVMCIARDASNVATAMCNHLKATADALDVRQETECPSGTAFNGEAVLRRRIATELESLAPRAPTTKAEG